MTNEQYEQKAQALRDQLEEMTQRAMKAEGGLEVAKSMYKESQESLKNFRKTINYCRIESLKIGHESIFNCCDEALIDLAGKEK